MKNWNLTIEIDGRTHLPCRFYNFNSAPSKRKPSHIAQSIIRRIAPIIHIRPNDSSLRFEQVKTTLTGYHVMYQQIYLGIPISRAWLQIDIDKKGRVFNILNNLIPEWMLKGETCLPQPRVSEDRAKELVIKNIVGFGQTRDDFIKTELIYFPRGNNFPVLAWKLLVSVCQPHSAQKVYLDADSGNLLEKIDMLKHASGKGRIFDPNPVISLNDRTIKNESLIPPTAYKEVDLIDLDNSGNLDGLYVSTRNTANRITDTTGQFLFFRDKKPFFKEVMAYYHIDRYQRYLQELGIDVLKNKQIEVNVEHEGSQSRYDSIKKNIIFGTAAGVDDAEDAEMIIHEYGHAIMDVLKPNFCSLDDALQAKAIEEGLCDYLAASFFEPEKKDDLKSKFASWAGTNSRNVPPFIRRLNSPKKFNNIDFKRDPHQDGEIWSSCLWMIRERLGQKPADKLIIESITILALFSTFSQAAQAIIDTDVKLYNGINGDLVKDIFKSKKIL